MPPSAYAPGTVLWALIDGFPWWPARVVRPSELVLGPTDIAPEPSENDVLVEFFNDGHRFAILSSTRVRPFDQPPVAPRIPRSGPFAASLRDAVCEAAKYAGVLVEHVPRGRERGTGRGNRGKRRKTLQGKEDAETDFVVEVPVEEPVEVSEMEEVEILQQRSRAGVGNDARSTAGSSWRESEGGGGGSGGDMDEASEPSRKGLYIGTEDTQVAGGNRREGNESAAGSAGGGAVGIVNGIGRERRERLRGFAREEDDGEVYRILSKEQVISLLVARDSELRAYIHQNLMLQRKLRLLERGKLPERAEKVEEEFGDVVDKVKKLLADMASQGKELSGVQ